MTRRHSIAVALVIAVVIAPAIVSDITVTSMPCFCSSQAVSFAPCWRGLVSSATTCILFPASVAA